MATLDIGRIGIWTFALELQPSVQAQAAAAEIESLGYGALWIPEAMGREALTHAGLLLAATRRLTIATGIANVWGRDAMTMAAGQKTLDEAYPGRFLLGLGVSHAPLVEGLRGHRYEKPLSFMRRYLDAMDAAPFVAAPPSRPSRRVIGALAPKMLALSAQRSDGAHPYFVPPEHTARAREILGEGPTLAPEQKVLLETDATKARAAARAAMTIYLGLPNYQNNLKWLGYGERDFAGGGSDRLVDAIVAWGDEAAIAKRIQEHRDAGADHVCIQPLRSDGGRTPDERILEALAPARR
jgi:probable F420-dependent oxidoreductase